MFTERHNTYLYYVDVVTAAKKLTNSAFDQFANSNNKTLFLFCLGCNEDIRKQEEFEDED